MKLLGRLPHCFLGLGLLILIFPGIGAGQASGILESGKAQRTPSLGQVAIPVTPDFSPQEVTFTVEGPDLDHFPVALGKRIFSETLHEITRAVNAERPPAVRLKLLLRMGEDRDYVHTTFGAQKEGTQISMVKWNEVKFARLLARAVRNCLLSDQQMDEAAHSAVRRAHMLVSAEELRGH